MLDLRDFNRSFNNNLEQFGLPIGTRVECDTCEGRRRGKVINNYSRCIEILLNNGLRTMPAKNSFISGEVKIL